jgi:hypothetical protein
MFPDNFKQLIIFAGLRAVCADYKNAACVRFVMHGIFIINKLLAELNQNILFEQPRPLGRGFNESILPALATIKLYLGLKPRFLCVLFPRPKGQGY